MNYNKLQLDITRAMRDQDLKTVRKLLRERKNRAPKQSVKILVLGDDGVGKSSLICTLISNHFNESEMPDCYTDVSIPENAVWDNNVTVTIMDSSQNTSSEELKLKILEADSIVLVYDIEKRETLDHLMSYWLPLIVNHTQAPVILAGNKVESRSDLIGSEEMESLGERHIAEVAPLLERYRNHIWACYECSAKTQRGVIEVFHIAQHVVVYPNGPLFDPAAGDLTPKCVAVIKRIFRFFDQDCDGLLNGNELNKFQTHCFEVPMNRDEFSALHKVIMRDTNGQGVCTCRDSDEVGVTLIGFQSIIRLFIKKDKFETPWMLLRLFGYNDSLNIPPETKVQNSIIPPSHCHILSKHGIGFLTKIFYQFCKTKILNKVQKKQVLYLNQLCLDAIFEVVPSSDEHGASQPWEVEAWEGSWTIPSLYLWNVALIPDQEDDEKEEAAGTRVEEIEEEEEEEEEEIRGNNDTDLFGMTLDRWLSLWCFCSTLNPELTQRFISYLGYTDRTFEEKYFPAIIDRGNLETLVQAAAPPPQEEESFSMEKSGDQVIRVLVTGSDQCGKSQLIQHLAFPSSSYSECTSTTSTKPVSTLIHFPQENNTEGREALCCLLVTEVGSDALEEVISNHQFDVALLCFDLTSSSLSNAQVLEKLIPSSLPRLYVATKIDVNNHTLKAMLVRQNDQNEDKLGISEIATTCESQPIYSEACQYCLDAQLPSPIPTSAMKRLKNQCREVLLSAAIGKTSAIPTLEKDISDSSSLSMKLFKALCIGALASLTMVATSTLLKKYYGVETMTGILRKASLGTGGYQPPKLSK